MPRVEILHFYPMVSFFEYAARMICVSLCLGIACCTFPVRTGYDRNIGDYKPIPASETASKPVAAKSTPVEQEKATKNAPENSVQDTTKHAKNSVTKARETINKKEAAKAAQKAAPRGSLENYARGWMGAKYVYGAATKTKTDCSGFVMQVYKGYYGISLDHNASKMYKDDRGKSVSRGSLKEGDLVFFGSLWKIDHVGIYLSGDRFIHASTSKGVMISPMQDKYWGHKYQGGRRFR